MAGRWDAPDASAVASVSSRASMSLRVGSDAWAHCHTYSDAKPILAAVAGAVHLSVTCDRHDGAVTAADLSFARQLASAAQSYLAALEDLHAQSSGADEEPGAA